MMNRSRGRGFTLIELLV
ncbi:MAG: type II secretion system protein, partial [Planctomycetaceae bacterium]|nr:type II secretion system protein [Planctomycetaceae bacterium]